MTELLDKAIARTRTLPPETQDEFARVLLRLAGDEEPIYQLIPEEEADLEAADAEIARGEFATDEQARDGQATSRRGDRRVILTPYPYVLFYRVVADDIVITRFSHAARRSSSEPGGRGR